MEIKVFFDGSLIAYVYPEDGLVQLVDKRGLLAFDEIEEINKVMKSGLESL